MFALYTLPVAGLLWAVGAAVAFLAIADRLVDHDDGWFVNVLLAAGINCALTLTGIGWLLAFGIAAAGFGSSFAVGGSAAGCGPRRGDGTGQGETGMRRRNWAGVDACIGSVNYR